jgi:hypothetical protein
VVLSSGMCSKTQLTLQWLQKVPQCGSCFGCEGNTVVTGCMSACANSTLSMHLQHMVYGARCVQCQGVGVCLHLRYGCNQLACWYGLNVLCQVHLIVERVLVHEHVCN